LKKSWGFRQTRTQQLGRGERLAIKNQREVWQQTRPQPQRQTPSRATRATVFSRLIQPRGVESSTPNPTDIL